jgi:hypothetical protein
MVFAILVIVLGLAAVTLAWGRGIDAEAGRRIESIRPRRPRTRRAT